MADKPAQPCYIKRGGAIGNFPGFAATWNWLVSCMWHLRGGRFASVTGVKRGRPVVEASPFLMPGGAGGGGGGSCDCPRKWYNRITLNAAGTQATISNPRVLHGVYLVTQQKEDSDLVVDLEATGDTWIYYEISDVTGTAQWGVWQYELKASGTEPSQFSGETYQVPLYVVDSSGRIWDASIPSAVKRN